MHPDGNSSGTEGRIQKDLVCCYMLKTEKMQKEVHKHRKKYKWKMAASAPAALCFGPFTSESFTAEWWWQIHVFSKILICGVLVLI